MLFQLGWWGTVLSARTPWEPYAPLMVGGVLGIHLTIAAKRGREILLILMTGSLGFVMDSLWAHGGVFQYVKPVHPPWLSPPWMVALWLNFGILPNHSLAYLRRRYLLAAILGIFGGPLAYYGGMELGLLVFSSKHWWSLSWIALEWGMAAPLIFFINDWIRNTKDELIR